jgi:hypothetical protein
VLNARLLPSDDTAFRKSRGLLRRGDVICKNSYLTSLDNRVFCCEKTSLHVFSELLQQPRPLLMEAVKL